MPSPHFCIGWNKKKVTSNHKVLYKLSFHSFNLELVRDLIGTPRIQGLTKIKIAAKQTYTCFILMLHEMSTYNLPRVL